MPTLKTRARRAKHATKRVTNGTARRATKRPSSKKVDVYKEYAAEYVMPKTPVFVDVGEAVYLTVDGQGEPGGEAFSAAVGALYTVAFTVKMASKFAGRDYAVSKLEAFWWTEPEGPHFMKTPRNEWHWKVMIRIPDFVTEDEVAGAISGLLMKGKPQTVRSVRRERITEGHCVQMLHVGAYADEPRSLELMQRLADTAGVKFTGRHHEIYLSDPKRVTPEKLRTILRHAVG